MIVTFPDIISALIVTSLILAWIPVLYGPLEKIFIDLGFRKSTILSLSIRCILLILWCFVLYLMIEGYFFTHIYCDYDIVDKAIANGDVLNCLDYWLNRYQTFITGLAAFFVAFAAYVHSTSKKRDEKSVKPEDEKKKIERRTHWYWRNKKK